MNKLVNLPVIGPIIVLLKSPALFAMIITLVVDMFISLHPAFEALRVPLLAIASTLGMLLMGGTLVGRIAAMKGVPFYQLPFFGPVYLLLRSRKFWYGVGTLLTAMLVAFIPEFESVQGELIATIALIGGTLIGGVTWEDVAANRPAPLAMAMSTTTGADGVGSTSTMSLDAVGTPVVPDIDALVVKVIETLITRGLIPAPKV